MQKEDISTGLNFKQILDNESDIVNVDYNSDLAVLLKSNNITIAVIESVTGGGIARKLIEVPGSSNYFLGGVIAYDSKLKIKYGLVNPKTIRENGLVSAAVTEEMANGIKKMTQADITIASNGIAGPRNENYSKIKDGTVFLSWNIHDKIIKTKRFNIEGARNEVIDKTVFTALSMCLLYLKNELRKEG